MTSSSNSNARQQIEERRTPVRIVDTQPLLRALVHESRRRSQTLRQLAEHLGVDYRRLAQWRSDDESIARAHRSVFERAARYLRIPYVLVLVLAGAITTRDLAWPEDSKAILDQRINGGIEQLRDDPLFSGSVPSELEHAPRSIKLFILFLYDHIASETNSGEKPIRWLSTLSDVRALLDSIDVTPESQQQG
jgi:hypothetical protein